MVNNKCLTKFILVDEQNTCRRAICECDRRLAMDLAKLEDTASMDFHSKPKFRKIKKRHNITPTSAAWPLRGHTALKLIL